MFSVNPNNNNPIPPQPSGTSANSAPALDSTVIAAVEDEVRRRVGNSESFTALEISRAVQAQGITERHRNLKTVVHEMFENGEMPNYDRTLISLPTGEQPFLYHPTTRTPAVRNSFSTATNLPGSSGQATGQSRSGLRPGAVITRILNGFRLRLPAPLLRAAGFWPGDTVYVARDPGGHRFSLHATPGNAPLTVPRQAYRVEADNSLRLTVLPSAGSPGANNPVFSVTFRTHGVVEIVRS